MSKKWEATHTAADGTPLMLDDGKLYSQFNWDNFGPAHRGAASPLVTVDWGTDTETTEDTVSEWQVWYGGGDCHVSYGSKFVNMDSQLLSHYVYLSNAGAGRVASFASQISYMLEQRFGINVPTSEVIVLMDNWRIAENK